MFKSLKKITVSFVAAACMATAVVPAALAAELPAYDFKAAEVDYESGHPFTDVNPRYDEAVNFFYYLDIIKGISPTEFGTYNSLKRGDAAVILANTLELDTKNAPDAGFTDLNDRVKGAVNALAAEGIVSGVTADKFEPQNTLSRGAMAKILVLGFGLEDYATETPFTDATGVFQPYIEALYGTEITAGTTATSYGTYQEIKRGDFANLLYNTVKFSIEDGLFYADSAEIINSSTLSISFTEAIPEDYTAQDIADSTLLTAYFSDGSYLDLIPENATFSDDRKTVTFNHQDLDGYSGTLEVDLLEGLDFDYE